MVLRSLDFKYAYGFADRAAGAVYDFNPDECLYLRDLLDGDVFARQISKPQKQTLLHTFLRNLNFSDFDYITGHYPDEAAGQLREFIDAAGLNVPSWLSATRVQRHIRELDQLLEAATSIVTNAAFHILFADRQFLFDFQKIVSEKITGLKYEDHIDVFKRIGVLKRPTIPQWLKRAVFHRDKGRCQSCFTDLTGILTVNDKLRIDHMIPLAKAGSNDPTNFQLLCESCNQYKSENVVFDPQQIYTFW